MTCSWQEIHCYPHPRDLDALCAGASQAGVRDDKNTFNAVWTEKFNCLLFRLNPAVAGVAISLQKVLNYPSLG